MAPVYLNKKGFSLIEVLVSLVILMVGLMGLLQATNVALEHNMRNHMRIEGVNLADQEMAQMLSRGFLSISTSQTQTQPVTYIKTRQVMTVWKNYSVVRTATAVSSSKMVNFVISWGYKGARYNHRISSVISATN